MTPLCPIYIINNAPFVPFLLCVGGILLLTILWQKCQGLLLLKPPLYPKTVITTHFGPPHNKNDNFFASERRIVPHHSKVVSSHSKITITNSAPFFILKIIKHIINLLRFSKEWSSRGLFWTV